MIVRIKLPPYQRRKRGPTKTSKYQKMIAQTILNDLPSGTELLESQVAGHTFQIGTDEIGMLKDQQDGSVLKAAVKPICGAREIKFYETLNDGNSNDPSIQAIRKFVPEYRGTVKMPFRGKSVDFIKLADITHDMSEPCVMDIKIGKRTWDPLATPDKIQAEEQKYEMCKRNLGFCIPGFQVYDIKSGRIKRFGKDYGKKLNQNSVKEALKIFLNADTQLSRLLLMKFLSTLYSIQQWARTQTTLRLYSSSLLLAYDAKRLRAQIFCNRNNRNYSNGSTTASSRSSSVESASKLTPTSPNAANDWQASSNFDSNNKTMQLLAPNQTTKSSSTTSTTTTTAEATINANGRIHSSINNHTTQSQTQTNNGRSIERENSSFINDMDSIQLYKKLQKSHSTQNNYEEDMKHIRNDYDLYLDNLMDECNELGAREWAFVKMIDFAHVFPANDDASTDTNYLFGIENLVKILEEFLRECD